MRPLSAQSMQVPLGLFLALSLVLVGCTNKNDNEPACEGDFCLEDLPSVELDPPETNRSVEDGGLETDGFIFVSTTMTNAGTGVYTVTGLSFEYEAPEGSEEGETPAFELISPKPDELPVDIHSLAGQGFPKGIGIQVKYTKQADAMARTARIVLTTTAPESETVEINYSTERGNPEIATDRPSVDFGLVPKDTVGEETLYVLNTGTQTLAVSGSGFWMTFVSV